MSKTTIWHNPSCGSSNAALAYLREKNRDPEIFLYLRAKPDKPAIRDILKRLGLQPSQLLRPKEAKGQELGLYDGSASEDDILSAMATHSILIQRPIVITDRGAVIARPKGRIDDIL
jgi:arsenate reductase